MTNYYREQFSSASISHVEGGFKLTNQSGTRNYPWTDLETVFGYKLDRLTSDEICLDLFFSNGQVLTLSESLTGWDEFLNELEVNLLGISPNWYAAVVSPAFETCLTLLFDKRGRSQAQLEKLYYK